VISTAFIVYKQELVPQLLIIYAEASS